MSDPYSPKVPAWPPRSAPRLFVEMDLEEGTKLPVEGQQAHYLLRVMRVGEGDPVVLCDDRTGEWAARVLHADKRKLTLEAVERLRPREDVPDFWLCSALLKKDRFDFVLEKATELGVAQIAPLVTRRCVADRLNMDRARALVIEAAEQCARTALPILQPPVKLEALLRDWPEGRNLFFADERADENGETPAAETFLAHSGPAAVLIGPEGGFDDAERAMIRAHPAARPISLGPRILRGETAAIAAVALWMGVRGDWAHG